MLTHHGLGSGFAPTKPTGSAPCSLAPCFPESRANIHFLGNSLPVPGAPVTTHTNLAATLEATTIVLHVSKETQAPKTTGQSEAECTAHTSLFFPVSSVLRDNPAMTGEAKGSCGSRPLAAGPSLGKGLAELRAAGSAALVGTREESDS